MSKPAKTRNLGTWTEAKYWGSIRSHLRRMFRHNWEPAKHALLSMRRPAQRPDRPLLKWEFKCQACGHWHPRKDVELDHLFPCGSLLTTQDFGGFIGRLLPETSDAYQVLCKSCHLVKTVAEKAARKAA